MSSYQKFLRDNDLENGAMLGSFNEDDKYVVPDNVLAELLKIKKLITKYALDYIDCYAQISDYKIIFKIKYVDDKLDNKRYASLYLYEQYESLGKKYPLTTVVASFSHANDVMFFDALKKAFNLYTMEDLGEGKSIKDSNDVLEALLNGHKNISQILLLEMANENRKYVNSVLKVLKTTSSFNDFYKIFKERISKIKADKNTAKYFNEVKKVLDALVMEHYSEFSDYTRDYLDEINKDYMKKYEVAKQKSISKSTEQSSDTSKKGKGGKDSKKKGGKSASFKPFSLGDYRIDFNFDFSVGADSNKNYEKAKPVQTQEKTYESQGRPLFEKEFVDSINKKIAEKIEDISLKKVSDVYNSIISSAFDDVNIEKKERDITELEKDLKKQVKKEEISNNDETEFTL